MDTQCTEQLTKDVMKRVRRVYVWKTYGRPFVIECTLLGTVIGGSAFLVSIDNIYTNVAETDSFVEVSRFAVSAFQHTELSMKALSLAAVLLMVLIARDSITAVGRAFHRVRSAV